MTQLGNVTEIKAVIKQLDNLKERGLIAEWEIPYESILTRLSAAIFFMTPSSDNHLDEIWRSLEGNARLQHEKNATQQLSQLQWQFRFN